MESLIRSVKKAIGLSLGEQVVRYSELQTIVFEAANMVNGRPIGLKPDESSDLSYLSPNDILLGRSTSKVPDQTFDTNNYLSRRYRFVQALSEEFWKKWTNMYFPSLCIQTKWHHTKRNLQVGDVVVVAERKLPRNKWRIAKVDEVTPGIDGLVRRVKVIYKNKDSSQYTKVERSVQRFIVLLPVD